MKTIAIILFAFVGFSSFVQPPGSPSDMPMSDTSTVEMDAGKMNSDRQRSDTAAQIPKGPRARKNKK